MKLETKKKKPKQWRRENAVTLVYIPSQMVLVKSWPPELFCHCCGCQESWVSLGWLSWNFCFVCSMGLKGPWLLLAFRGTSVRELMGFLGQGRCTAPAQSSIFILSIINSSACDSVQSDEEAICRQTWTKPEQLSFAAKCLCFCFSPADRWWAEFVGRSVSFAWQLVPGVLGWAVAVPSSLTLAGLASPTRPHLWETALGNLSVPTNAYSAHPHFSDIWQMRSCSSVFLEVTSYLLFPPDFAFCISCQEGKFRRLGFLEPKQSLWFGIWIYSKARKVYPPLWAWSEYYKILQSRQREIF